MNRDAQRDQPERAAAALSALGGAIRCVECGDELSPGEYQCCSHTYCPFCGRDENDECEHLLAMEQEGSDWEPDEAFVFPGAWLGDAPVLAGELEHHEWTEEQLAEVFQELTPLLEA